MYKRMGERRSKRGRKRRNNRLKRWSLKGEKGGEGGQPTQTSPTSFLPSTWFFQVVCLFPSLHWIYTSMVFFFLLYTDFDSLSQGFLKKNNNNLFFGVNVYIDDSF